MSEQFFTQAELAKLTLNRAAAFMDAAHRIGHGLGLAEPRYFMYSHSIELSLKAFLMVKGLSEKECKSLGHDLTGALKEALQRGLQTEPGDRGTITTLSEHHNRPFSLRYFNEDGWSAPPMARTAKCCENVLWAAMIHVNLANGIPATHE